MAFFITVFPSHDSAAKLTEVKDRQDEKERKQ
jgi:hypothetical protein